MVGGGGGETKGKQRERETERAMRCHFYAFGSIFIVLFHANKLFNSTVWQLKANWKQNKDNEHSEGARERQGKNERTFL